jgi:hypothetical protein
MWRVLCSRRSLATALLLLAMALPIAVAWWGRRVRDSRALLRSASGALGRESVRRALASLDLADRIEADSAHEGISPALARLHAHRRLEALALGSLAPMGARRGKVARTVALALVSAAVVMLVVAPARFVEGVDVWLASPPAKGSPPGSGWRAPLPLPWIDGAAVTVRPPAYLHRHDYTIEGYRRVPETGLAAPWLSAAEWGAWEDSR